MTDLSFDRLLKSSRLAMVMTTKDALIVDRSIRMTRPDRERVEGKVGKSKGGAGGSSRGLKFSNKLSERLKMKSPRSAKGGGRGFTGAPMDFDQRQRAVVKIHYFNHANGGGAALKAHAKYVARDAAVPEDLATEAPGVEKPDERGRQAQAHADYLERGGRRGIFYDAEGSRIDGAGKIEAWARSDLRHFRLILSAEEGPRLKDLPAYTREVMARAGAALGTKLSWVAVDHHDTDNPHTHIILRGRRANGQDLVLPRDFIKHGFRSIARDVATEWLGRRSPEQERIALERETRRHGPTRLDAMIDAQTKDHRVRLSDLRAPNGDAALTQALKARTRELERMGLGEESERGLFRFTPDWRDRLQAIELHLDIRKRVVRERVERSLTQQQEAMRRLGKGPLGR
jgi:type IV secretory pathway VirD2 relaxase